MNTEPRYSLSDLLQIANGPGGAQFTLRWLFAQKPDDRVAIIEGLVDYAASEFAKHAHLKQQMSEDQLTQNLIDIVKGAGIDARHDVQVGGHCDIVVEASDNFVWLAEAKIHGSYAWLEKGFFQIATRYSTGLHGQDHGDLIVYVFNRDCRSVAQEWMQIMGSLHPAWRQSDFDQERLVFTSTGKHDRSGRDFRVRHKFFAMYYAPRA